MKSVRGFLKRKWLETRLEQPPLVVETPVPGTGQMVSFCVHTWFEYHNRAQGSYIGEPDMVVWLKESLKAGDIFWDIGANVGAYSILAAKLCPQATVCSFEPFIPTFSHLWENVVLNGVTASVHPINIGLSNRSGATFLGINDPRAGSSQHQVGEAKGGLQQKLLAFKGDDVVARLGVPSPTLLKLDIDGLEIQAVEGLKEVLLNPGLRSVMIEVETGKTEEPVQRLLQAAGLTRIDNPLAQPTNGVFNALFVRK